MKFLFWVLKVLVWIINISIYGNLLLELEWAGIYLGVFPQIYMIAGMILFAKTECHWITRKQKARESLKNQDH